MLPLKEKVEDVPYIPGMGWRIMDVIDPENELQSLYDAIHMKDGIDQIIELKGKLKNGTKTTL